jgi:sugar phosphate permease
MRTIAKLRWWIIALVTLSTILNYLARSTLSVAAPTLKTEFAMSTEEYSWVVLAFQATYTITNSGEKGGSTRGLSWQANQTILFRISVRVFS